MCEEITWREVLIKGKFLTGSLHGLGESVFLTTAQELLMLSKEDQVERRKMGKVFRMKKSG